MPAVKSTGRAPTWPPAAAVDGPLVQQRPIDRERAAAQEIITAGADRQAP